MTCPNCGAELAAGQKFCNKCGFNVEAAQTQGSGNDQHVTQPTDNQNNGGSTNGPVNGTSGDQLDQMNNGQNNAQPTGNNGQGAGFDPNNVNNGPQAGLQPANGNNNQNAGFDPNKVNNSQNAGFNPNNGNNNQNAEFNPDMANNGQAGFQQNGSYNGQNPGYQPNMGNNGQQFNGQGQQGFNNQGQFQNGQGSFQQQPNGFGYMMPFLKNNVPLAVCAGIIILLIAIFNWKAALGVLVVAAIAWYFIADKNHDQTLPLSHSIGSVFSGVGNAPQIDNAETNKLKLIVGIAGIAGLLFLFVGNFISLTFDISSMANDDSEVEAALQYFNISGSAFTFSSATSTISKVLKLAIAGNSYAGYLASDSDNTLQIVKTVFNLYRWLIYILPILTIVFAFVKTKASSIVRIIASGLSTILLAILQIGLITLHNSDDQTTMMASQFFDLGYSYYIVLIASIVALVFSIRWSMINVKNAANARAQQTSNYNMQQNNFGNPNQGNFNGNQNIPNNPAGFNNGQNGGNVSGDQNGADGSGN